jgi:beta-lactamase class A
MRRRSRRFAPHTGVATASAVSALLALGIVATWPKSTPAAPISAAPRSPAPSISQSAPAASIGSTRTPSPAHAHATSARRVRKALTTALDRYLRDRSAQLTLSIRDLSTGFTFTYRPKTRTATASIVKVDILIALLLKAQREDRRLTARERALATQMIEVSDNKAANALWYAAGGAAGLAAANKKLRLRDTSPGTGGLWGATMTSAADQIRILRALTSTRSPLSTRSRRYVLDLMSHVTPRQVWGVSAAAADADDTVALKNGWLPRPVDGGRWTVNSIGRVRGEGHDYLIAVLSKLNPSMAAGVETVEHATRLVTSTRRHATY